MKKEKLNHSQKLYESLRLEILNEKEEGKKFYSIRQLVIKYNLNINTVLKVLKKLELDGYLYAKKGKGYFIARNKKMKIDKEEMPLMKNFHGNNKNNQEINLANGSPNIENYPYLLYEELTIKALKKYKFELLGYQDVQGLESLRKILADEIEKRDIFINFEDIIITSGTQLALVIILKMFVDINRKITGISSPDYPNSFNLMKGIMDIRTFELKYDGWDLNKFEKFLKKEKLDLIYLVPNFHNPTGITWSEEKKKRIVELAEKYDFYIIEDDCFSDFYYTKKVSTLKSFDKIGRERVIYIKTYSKVMMPDLGLAMMVLPPVLSQRALYVKYCIDHNTSGLRQKVLEYLIIEGYLDQHLFILKKRLKGKYKEAIKLLSEINEITILTKIKGGFFIWIKLPTYITEKELCEECKKRGVNILPGNLFYLDEKITNKIRISFITPTIDEIRRGIKILKEVLEKFKKVEE